MTLREIVAKYKSLAPSFGAPATLSSFGLTPAETETTFSQFDEDYHISRYFHFTLKPGSEAYVINAFPQSHVSLDAEIVELL